MSRLLTLLALVSVSAFGVAHADVYRWVDEHGEPHYSDQWVPGSQIIKTTKPRNGEARSEKSLTTVSSRISGQLDDQANARAVQQDVTRARDAQCKAAKDRYLKAIQSRRVFKEAKNGEREYLSDTDADAYREVARKDVEARCGSVPQFDPNAPIPEPQPIPQPKVNPADATSN